MRLVDVEHAATATDGVAHGAGAPPPMRYEGFEPSPYDQENARETELGIVCPQSELPLLSRLTLFVHRAMISVLVQPKSLHQYLT
jgi:vacuolar protein sorting-associated protein 18